MSFNNFLQFFTSSGFKVWIKKPKANVQSSVFRLYKATACVMAIASTLSMGKQLFGDPITCIAEGHLETPKFVNDFCWFHGTRTYDTSGDRDGWMAATGVKYVGKDGRDQQADRAHDYYQWVGLVLFLQALTFSMPFYWWKVFEGGKLDRMLKNRKRDSDSKKNRGKDDRGGKGGSEKSENGSGGGGGDSTPDMIHLGEKLADHFGSFRRYASKYVLVEVAAALGVGGHVLFIDWLLDGSFLDLGASVVREGGGGAWRDRRNHPLEVIFPRLASCTVSRFSSNGNLQNVEALCVIPLNIINEKIYLLLWFWLLLVAVFACVHLALVLLLVVSAFPRVVWLEMRCPSAGRRSLGAIAHHAGFSDWLITSLVLRNVEDERQRLRFLHALADRLSERRRRRKGPRLSRSAVPAVDASDEAGTNEGPDPDSLTGV